MGAKAVSRGSKDAGGSNGNGECDEIKFGCGTIEICFQSCGRRIIRAGTEVDEISEFGVVCGDSGRWTDIQLLKTISYNSGENAGFNTGGRTQSIKCLRNERMSCPCAIEHFQFDEIDNFLGERPYFVSIRSGNDILRINRRRGFIDVVKFPIHPRFERELEIPIKRIIHIRAFCFERVIVDGRTAETIESFYEAVVCSIAKFHMRK